MAALPTTSVHGEAGGAPFNHRSSDMARVTLYVVQFFSRQSRKLAADPPLNFKTAEAAIGRAERGLATKAGVLVTARSGDPEADDWDDPEILMKSGQLPRGIADDD